jgi:pimeloyl-ACP methyl ester carboxylesterase
LRPDQAFEQLSTPTLVLHGTGDTFVPVQSSREYIAKIPVTSRLIEIEGAQHGIAVPDDPRYLHPQTQRWQADAIRNVADWLLA